VQPFIDNKAQVIVGMSGRAQDLNFEIAYIESLAIGEVAIPVSETRFFAMSNFCACLPL
jgi:hypothetical protein